MNILYKWMVGNGPGILSNITWILNAIDEVLCLSIVINISKFHQW